MSLAKERRALRVEQRRARKWQKIARATCVEEKLVGKREEPLRGEAIPTRAAPPLQSPWAPRR